MVGEKLLIARADKMGKLVTNRVSQRLHRVMCADFSIGGYGLGGSIKHGLLQREDREYEESAEVKMDGKILLLSPVKRPRKAELSKN